MFRIGTIVTAAAALTLGTAGAQAATANFFFSFDTLPSGTGDAFDPNVTASNFPGTPTVSKTFTIESAGNPGGASSFKDYTGTTWLGSGGVSTPGHSMTWNPGSTGNSISLTFSTVGLGDLKLRFNVRSGGTGSPTSFTNFTYDTGNGPQDVGVADLSFSAGSFVVWTADLSALDAIENQPQVTLTWTFADLGSSPAQSMRIDNIEASATTTAVPSPAALPLGAVLGAGLLSAGPRRRAGRC